MSDDISRIALDELIRYVVSAEELHQAMELVRRYEQSSPAMAVLRSYYTTLPEGREEMVTSLRLVKDHDGYLLVGLETTAHRYLFVASEGEAVYIGAFEEGVDDQSVAELFGFRDPDEYAKLTPPFEQLGELPTRQGAQQPQTCVVCGAGAGLLHAFGCPVELCPWCGGQLNRCNCRFDQLGVDSIDTEAQIDRLAELLDEKGRIPFAVGQNPGYPVAGGDEGPVPPIEGTGPAERR